MDLFKSKKGYTLLEMIISMAIFAVLLIVFTQIIFSALRISNEISVRSQFRETITEVIDLIKRDIRNADGVGDCNGDKCVIAFENNVEWGLCPADEGVNTICKYQLGADGSRELLKKTPENVFVNRISFETFITDPNLSSGSELTNNTIIVTIEATAVQTVEDRQQALDGQTFFDVRQIVVSTRNVKF